MALLPHTGFLEFTVLLGARAGSLAQCSALLVPARLEVHVGRDGAAHVLRKLATATSPAREPHVVLPHCPIERGTHRFVHGVELVVLLCNSPLHGALCERIQGCAQLGAGHELVPHRRDESDAGGTPRVTCGGYLAEKQRWGPRIGEEPERVCTSGQGGDRPRHRAYRGAAGQLALWVVALGMIDCTLTIRLSTVPRGWRGWAKIAAVCPPRACGDRAGSSRGRTGSDVLVLALRPLKFMQQAFALVQKA